MKYQVGTNAQLRAVMKALRKARGLSQTDVGVRLGVNQKRIAKIEAAPGVTGFDQIARMVSTLGGQIYIEDSSADAGPATANKPLRKVKSRQTARGKENW